MEIEKVSRWLIEPDWFEAISNNKSDHKPEFWVSHIDSATNTSIHETFHQTSSKEFESVDGTMSAELLESGNLKVSLLTSNQAECSFIRPRSELKIRGSSEGGMDLSPVGGSLLAISQRDQVQIHEISSNSINTTARRCLQGHLSDVSCVRFFPSGQVLLTGGLDMQLRIWDLSTGECARVLQGHKRSITGLGIIERGRTVLSSSKDGTLKLWECASASVVRSFESKSRGSIEAVSVVSRDSQSAINGLAIYVSDMGELGALDIRQPERWSLLPSHDTEFSALDTLASDTVQIITGSTNGVISLWDMRNIKQPAVPYLRIKRNESCVNSVKFANDGLFYAGSSDGSLFSYQTTTGTLSEFTTDQTPVYSIATTESSQLIAAGSRISVRTF